MFPLKNKRRLYLYVGQVVERVSVRGAKGQGRIVAFFRGGDQTFLAQSVGQVTVRVGKLRLDREKGKDWEFD